MKGDARKWLTRFEAEQAATIPPVVVTTEVVKGLWQQYRSVRDADKTWQIVKTLRQGETKVVEHFLKQFEEVWEQLCLALMPEQPPTMMKKGSFIASLKLALRWRVELKNLGNCEDAVDVAKNKEWKAQRLTQLGVGTPKDKLELKRVEMVPTAMRRALPVVEPQVVQPMVAVGGDKDMKKDMKQMVDLMKNLSINLMNNPGAAGRGRGRISEGGG